MKAFDELEHMRIYNQPIMVPYNEKNKKKGTVVQIVTPMVDGASTIINNSKLRNPNLINGYYIDKGITHLISDKPVHESVAAVGGSAIAAKVAMDIAVKYGKKWIDAKEAKTPNQKQTAAIAFMPEYRRGLKAYNKYKANETAILKNVAPDAWWITYFRISANDIKAIGTNPSNKMSKTVFDNFITKAMNNKITNDQVKKFRGFLADKDFYKVSYAVEDVGAPIPWKVEYVYCPQTDKIYKCSKAVNVFTLDYNHPMTIMDYLNRSRASMLEIQDVLDICDKKNKEKK